MNLTTFPTSDLRRSLRGLVALAFALLLSFLLAAGPAGAAEVLLYHPDGTIGWIEGNLGRVSLPPVPAEPTEGYYEEAYLALRDGLEDALGNYFGTTGEEQMDLASMAVSEIDRVKIGNLKLDQKMEGLTIQGGGFRARVDLDAGQILAIHGRVYPWQEEYAAAISGALPFENALAAALAEMGTTAELHGDPELVFMAGGPQLVLGHRVLATLADSADVGPVFLSIAAADGRFLGAEPVRLTGPPSGPGDTGPWPTIGSTQKLRSHNGSAFSSLPPYGPQLLCSTNLHFPVPGFLSVPTSACTPDDSVARAHGHAIQVYRFFREVQGWHSYDGNGADVVSIANELDDEYMPLVGAYWHKLTLDVHYGDGNGTFLLDATLGFDVAAHELSHGVTQFRNGLVYNKEPGAINEAFSDIFAAAAEYWKDGGFTAGTFLVGEDVAGSNLGQALRYMHDPSLDGISPDYYPERLYPEPDCFPVDANDWCGVHFNSGIANLAFYLLVNGGQHPHGKTSVVVPGIGMEKAREVFFEAHGMLNALDGFHALRLATEQAAANLYDSATAAAVSASWSAVGVDP